eukprot:EG_transcript_32098
MKAAEAERRAQAQRNIAMAEELLSSLGQGGRQASRCVGGLVGERVDESFGESWQAVAKLGERGDFSFLTIESLDVHAIIVPVFFTVCCGCCSLLCFQHQHQLLQVTHPTEQWGLAIKYRNKKNGAGLKITSFLS